jgi:hypothetical protein
MPRTVLSVACVAALTLGSPSAGSPAQAVIRALLDVPADRGK